MRKRLVNTPSNTVINFKSPEQFIGMVITKRNLTAECFSFEPHTTKENQPTFLLHWRISAKENNESVVIKTSWNFRVGDIPKNYDGCLKRAQ